MRGGFNPRPRAGGDKFSPQASAPAREPSPRPSPKGERVQNQFVGFLAGSKKPWSYQLFFLSPRVGSCPRTEGRRPGTGFRGRRRGRSVPIRKTPSRDREARKGTLAQRPQTGWRRLGREVCGRRRRRSVPIRKAASRDGEAPSGDVGSPSADEKARSRDGELWKEMSLFRPPPEDAVPGRRALERDHVSLSVDEEAPSPDGGTWKETWSLRPHPEGAVSRPRGAGRRCWLAVGGWNGAAAGVLAPGGGLRRLAPPGIRGL